MSPISSLRNTSIRSVHRIRNRDGLGCTYKIIRHYFISLMDLLNSFSIFRSAFLRAAWLNPLRLLNEVGSCG